MTSKIFISIAVLLLLGMGALFYRQHKQEENWQAERAAWEQRFAEQSQLQAVTAAARLTAANDSRQLHEQLLVTSNELVTARLKVEAYEAKRALEAQAQAAELRKASDLTQLRAAVPAPLVATRRAADGKEQRQYTFPKLVGAGGNTLANDAEFRKQFGRRLVFRAGSGRPLAYDVDELHPGVLLHLGLSREAALNAQEEIDRQAKAAEEKHRAQLAARAEAEKKAAEQRARLAVEYAKVAEERRKAQVDEQLKFQAAETERLKAEASMRAADAAVQEALRPFYPEYFIQQVLTPPPVIIVPQSQSQPTNPFVRDPRVN